MYMYVTKWWMHKDITLAANARYLNTVLILMWKSNILFNSTIVVNKYLYFDLHFGTCVFVVKHYIPLAEEKADSSSTDSENKTTKQETDQSDDKENSNSKTDKVDDQPKCVAKPPLPSKPVVLPKPVKLSKPDTPKQFG